VSVKEVRFEVLTTASSHDIAASIIRAIDLMMEPASTSETFVNFYQTTRHNNLEDEISLSWCRDENSTGGDVTFRHPFPCYVFGLFLTTFLMSF
jgi:hypothetical protein